MEHVCGSPTGRINVFFFLYGTSSFCMVLTVACRDLYLHEACVFFLFVDRLASIRSFDQMHVVSMMMFN